MQKDEEAEGGEEGEEARAKAGVAFDGKKGPGDKQSKLQQRHLAKLMAAKAENSSKLKSLGFQVSKFSALHKAQ